MTNKDRVLALLYGEKVSGHLPAANFLTAVNTDLMNRSGVSWPSAHGDARAMAALAAATHIYYGFDTLKLPFDMTVEAEAMGATPVMGDNRVLPQISGCLFDSGVDFKITDELFTRGRIPTVLEAIKIATTEYKNALTVSSVVGPFTLASKLYDFEEILIMTLENPARLKTILENVTDFCERYMKMQESAGCDVIQLGEASCSGDLISGETYREFIMPCHARLARAVKKPTVLHICGYIEEHLPHISATGVTCLSFDSRTDARRAADELRGRTSAFGSIDTLKILRGGTPSDVENAVFECREAGISLIGAGCAWAPDTPEQNARALFSAIRRLRV